MTSAPSPVLLPMPRSLSLLDGTCPLPDHVLLMTTGPDWLFPAQWLQAGLQVVNIQSEIVAHAGGAPTVIRLEQVSDLPRPEAYRLMVTAETITLEAGDYGGIHAACATLRQLLRQYGRAIPCLRIDDYPDFPARGVMLDISRDKVPTMETLVMLVEKLAGWKVNQLQLYMEHTFAYQAHPEVWAEASPLTGQEILELDAFCRQHAIDLVPNQNSLGHMERWLKFPRYRPLAECPEGFESPWRGWSEPTTLNPLDPGSTELMTSLYAELLPHFRSPLFNVGGDEPWELGQGKSKTAIEQRGGRVYLEYLLKLYDLVKAHGRQMQLWGDIIIHYPDLVPELPQDLIVMEWGYEAIHDFDGHCKLFADSGIPFYVCPGTSSWNTLVGRTENMLGNLRNAAVSGLKHGAIGYLNTDWGDHGHWQPLSVSYAGFAVGAAYSWSYESSQGMDLPAVLDLHVFRDQAGLMGRLVVDLGNVYQLTGPLHVNSQPLALISQQSPEQLAHYFAAPDQVEEPTQADLSPATLRRYIDQVNDILAPLNQTDLQLIDGQLILSEYRLAGDLLLHAARRMLHLQGETESGDFGDLSAEQLAAERAELKARQRQVWLRRNRPGGLADSLNRWAE